MSDHPGSEKSTSLKRGTSWMDLARCRDVDPQVFFPGNGPGVEAARRYCAECVVRESCLEYALENHIQHGVWGGASERARRRMSRKRRAALARATGAPSPVWD